MTMQTSPVVSDAQKQQFLEEGYFILDQVMSEEMIEGLRGNAQNAIDNIHNHMDKAGGDVHGISVRNKRYFIIGEWYTNQACHDFLFSQLMAEVCKATIGEDAYLFYEQYVIKAAEQGISFAWHQDSGYVGYPHEPYLTCWCALDDMSEENGTVYVLPYSEAGIKSYVHHIKDPETNEEVGYFGKNPGVPVICKAGSIAVFSSFVFHRSGANTTDAMRRTYLAQYSGYPITKPNSDELWNHAVPFVKGGQYQPPTFPPAKPA